MPTYNILQTDLRDAELFLSTFMSEQVPEASFEKGGAVYDFLVKGFASLYAYLRGEIDRATARQSLKRIQEELTDQDDIAQAVDEILSNWFVTRKGGNYSRSTVRLHFTERRAQNIAATSKFYRTSTLYYRLDTPSSSYLISESQILPVFDSRGVLEDYVADVPMVSAGVGRAYDIPAGNFVRVEAPGGIPYFSYAENVDDFTGGKNIEGTAELIERAETSITVRNLINNRSCDTVLQEQYPEITETLTVGMSEPEMVRDLLADGYSFLRVHTGGKYDTYVSLPITRVEENLTIGAYFPRGDGLISVFRDPELTHDLSSTFVTLGVYPGHIIYVRSGIRNSPRGYIVSAVFDHELHVVETSPFTEASDEFEDQATNLVVYSIGWTSPSFSDVAFPSGHTRTAAKSSNVVFSSVPYGTSRRVQQSGKVLLQSRPIQDIESVEITNPTAALSELSDVSTGLVAFPNRVNTTPVYQAEPGALEYQLKVLNPLYAQSYHAVNLLTVGFNQGSPAFSSSDFDGMNLRVVYKTMSTFNNVAAYVESRDVRVAAANHLVRTRHPVWLEMVIYYRIKPTSSETLDIDAAAALLSQHINEFDPNDDLDTSDIETVLRSNFTMIGAVYPLTVAYTLGSPDGQQVEYTTTDIVTVFPSNTNQAQLVNGSQITPTAEMIGRGVVSVSTQEELTEYLSQLGVSDRTIRYRTTAGHLSFVQKG